jgi:hypothetical protein
MLDLASTLGIIPLDGALCRRLAVQVLKLCVALASGRGRAALAPPSGGVAALAGGPLSPRAAAAAAEAGTCLLEEQPQAAGGSSSTTVGESPSATRQRLRRQVGAVRHFADPCCHVFKGWVVWWC